MASFSRRGAGRQKGKVSGARHTPLRNGENTRTPQRCRGLAGRSRATIPLRITLAHIPATRSELLRHHACKKQRTTHRNGCWELGEGPIMEHACKGGGEFGTLTTWSQMTSGEQSAFTRKVTPSASLSAGPTSSPSLSPCPAPGPTPRPLLPPSDTPLTGPPPPALGSGALRAAFCQRAATAPRHGCRASPGVAPRGPKARTAAHRAPCVVPPGPSAAP